MGIVRGSQRPGNSLVDGRRQGPAPPGDARAAARQRLVRNEDKEVRIADIDLSQATDAEPDAAPLNAAPLSGLERAGVHLTWGIGALILAFLIVMLFQLFVRDLLSDEMMELADRLPNEQKKKQYLVSIIEGLKETEEWQQSGFAGKTVKTEAKKFREMRKKMKNKPKTQEGGSSSSSGGGIGSAIASGAKAVGGAILEAGKEAVKDAVVAGAQNAVLSLL